MPDHYLRFASAAEAATELDAAGFTADAGLLHAVDHVGTIWTAPVYDEAFELVTPAEPVAGWHVNLRLLATDLPESLEPFAIAPETPSRRFAS